MPVARGDHPALTRPCARATAPRGPAAARPNAGSPRPEPALRRTIRPCGRPARRALAARTGRPRPARL